MTRTDLTILAVLAVAILVVCALGGVEHPQTIAGSIARFVWSLR